MGPQYLKHISSRGKVLFENCKVCARACSGVRFIGVSYSNLRCFNADVSLNVLHTAVSLVAVLSGENHLLPSFSDPVFCRLCHASPAGSQTS